MKRTQKFSLQDATTKATTYVSDALRDVPNHPYFSNPFPIVELTKLLAAALLVAVGTNAFEEFCAFFISGLWRAIIAGDNTPIKYAELLATHVHAFRIDETLLSNWDSLLRDLNISCGQYENDCLLQHLIDCVLEALMTDRNSTDLPLIEETITNGSNMNKNEEQVLAYVAGYIPFALHKHYKRQFKNNTAEKYAKLLLKWCSNSLKYEGQYSFLEYTTHWIQAQSRGKLFQPNPRLFLLFRAAENETRKHLTASVISKYRDISINELLKQKLSSSYLIQQYWTTLTEDSLTCDESKHLFEITLDYFIRIRCRAFVQVYDDMKKVNDKTRSKKATQCLRKDLPQK